MVNVTFRNLLDEESEFKKIDAEYLMPAVCEYARTSNKEIYKSVLDQAVTIRHNGNVVHPDDWNVYDVVDGDEIVVTPILKGGDSGGWIQIAIGALLIGISFTLFGAPFSGILIPMGAAMMLGGISQLLFKPTLPSLGAFGYGDEGSQTYSWQGIGSRAQPDIPIPVVYGTHKVGGNIISLFTQPEGDDNYLYMLLGLCEGEIEGIVQKDALSTVCTTSNTASADYCIPAIEIDNQGIENYTDVEWWGRNGTNEASALTNQHDPTTQNQIPYFQGTRVEYTDGTELTPAGITYSTAGAVDMAVMKIKAPALYDASGGTVIEKTAKFKIQFRTGAEAFADATVVRYTPTYSVETGNDNVDACLFVKDQDVYVKPLDYYIKVTENTYTPLQSMQSEPIIRKDYQMSIQIKDNNETLLKTVTINQYMTRSGAFWTGPIQYHYTAFTVGPYLVTLTQNVAADDVFKLTTSTSSDNVIYITGKTKTGKYKSVTLDFNNMSGGSGETSYDIKLLRTDGGSSDSLTIENKLILESVTEVVQGNFIYPNTALLAFRMKATGQLSGGPPSITVIIKGTKVAVPDLSGSEAFDDHYYDATDERWEYGDAERTWDHTTWTTEYSHNAMCCVRDLLTNQRYGLGNYITSSDLYAAGITAAMKQCHLLYSEITDHYHQMNIVLDTAQSALTAMLEMCNVFRCWPVWYNGKFNFIIDTDDTPIHSLSTGNLISFSQSFTPLSEIPYKIAAQYMDANAVDDYTMRTLIARSTSSTLRTINEANIGLKGITHRIIAERELKHKLNQAVNCTHNIEFKCGLDSIHAVAGDIVYVQHDVPSWGQGGRILAYDLANASILMDESFGFTSPLSTASYLIRFQQDDNDFVTATVDTSATGALQTINLKSWVGSPCDDSVYQVGLSTSYNKKFRLLSTVRSTVEEVTCVAREHQSSLYTDPGIVTIDDVTASLPNHLRKPDAPNKVSVVPLEPTDGLGFMLTVEDIQYTTEFGIIETIVEMSDAQDSSFQTIAIIPTDRNYFKYINPNLVIDQIYYFKFSYRTRYKTGSATMIYCLLPPFQYQLLPPTGIHIKGKNANVQYFDGADVCIQWNQSGSSNTTGVALKGYKVEVYHTSITSANLLRTAFIKNEEFTYTYNDNLADGDASTVNSILVFALYTVNILSIESDPKYFTTYNSTPSAIGGLTATGQFKAVYFSWNPSSAIDFKHYSYRTKVETDDWSSWINTTDTVLTRYLTTTEVAAHGADSTIYIEVTVVDIYSNESSTETTSIDSVGIILSTDIEDFGVTPDKIDMNVPIIKSDSWTDNSPAAGYIAWNGHYLYYSGTEYVISANNTNLKYIWWENGDTAYSSSDTHPGEILDDDDFLIAVNISGTHDLAWNAIANQVIGTAYIERAAIGDAQINDLSASKINVGTLSGISIIGNEIKTAATGKKIIINSDGITLQTTDTTDKYNNFKYGDGTTYGSGVLAYLHHAAETVPFYISTEQNVADFHFYNRSSLPTGIAEIGDMCVVNGIIYVCSSGGEPGTWRDFD